MISKEQVGEALTFIAETDHQFAEAKTEVERSSWLCKHVRAIVYEMSDRAHKVDERHAFVERHENVVRAEERRLAAVLAFEEIKAQRETKALLVDVYRTCEASRRAGIV